MEMTCLNDRLTFDPDAHVYRLDGQAIPGTTTILSDLNLIDTRWFTDEARERGTIVHKLLHFAMECRLDWESVDPELLGYMQSAMKFIEDLQIKPILVECPLASITYRYGGTIDLFGESRMGLIEVDWKSGVHYSWHNLQLALYDNLLLENGYAERRPERHVTVCLDPKGEYPKLCWLERSLPRGSKHGQVTYNQARSIGLQAISLYNFKHGR